MRTKGGPGRDASALLRASYGQHSTARGCLFPCFTPARPLAFASSPPDSSRLPATVARASTRPLWSTPPVAPCMVPTCAQEHRARDGGEGLTAFTHGDSRACLRHPLNPAHARSPISPPHTHPGCCVVFPNNQKGPGRGAPWLDNESAPPLLPPVFVWWNAHRGREAAYATHHAHARCQPRVATQNTSAGRKGGWAGTHQRAARTVPNSD
jgi:hypothetical protein